MKKILSHTWFLLIGYIVFFISLSLYFNKDVLFNPYNYGRHWDWSLYANADFYREYIKSFFYAIKVNSLGYFDVAGISFAEFTLKSAIYFTYLFASWLKISVLTIPVINKLTIFVILPIISSFFVLLLCKKILHEVSNKSPVIFFIIAAFCNLLYSYSLVMIFDLHGGALNRQISSSFFPLWFYFIYSYVEDEVPSWLNKNIFILTLFFIVFDISNIFYFSVLLFIVILLKKLPAKIKIFHLLTIGFLTIFLNLYWLHSLFIGNTSNLGTVISQRTDDFSIIANYSLKYIDDFFFINTPHNLIVRTFDHRLTLFIPYFFLYLFIVLNLIKARLSREKLNKIFFLFAVFVITTILANGVLGLGPFYKWLYSFKILAFIRSPIRYVPNLLIFVIFFFLVTTSLNEDLKAHYRKFGIILLIPIFLWTLFLLTHSNLIELVNKNAVGSSKENHDIGALYQYDNAINKRLNGDDLVYNVLPIPSFFSPVFRDNVYPKTSQGSETDSYFKKGILYTNGVPSTTTSFFESFINSNQSRAFYSLTNVKYLYLKTAKNVDERLNKEHFFSYYWAKISDQKAPSLQEVDKSDFYPKIYVPRDIVVSDVTPVALPQLIQKNTDMEKTKAFFFRSQNLNNYLTTNSFSKTNDFPIVEFKKINSAKYRVIIHGAKNVFPLVFSESYYDGWKAYLNGFDIKRKNVDIKKTIKGTIQNNDLSDGPLFATWNSKQIPDSYHLLVNAYANSWVIDPKYICAESRLCGKNEDGSYDISIILYFLPQKIFMISLTISLLSVIVVASLIIRLKLREVKND